MNDSIVSDTPILSHNVFELDSSITFRSDFDSGNLAKVVRTSRQSYEFKIWTAPDNMGTEFQSKNSFWFYFTVQGLNTSSMLKIQIANASNHANLYKYDMRPVYRCRSTNNKWQRIRYPVKFQRENDNNAILCFEHMVDENAGDEVSFAFTYPYTYTMLMEELIQLDSHKNDMSNEGSIFYQRELLTYSGDNRRIDLLTVTSVEGAHKDREPLLPDLFPNTKHRKQRPPIFPNKEIIFISARVHPGEVPAQHTLKGILNFILDPSDLRARELRRRYVFKIIPMLNPDGVFRGHCRMDQRGQNLNRYYTSPDSVMQPTIFAAKQLLDLYGARSLNDSNRSCEGSSEDASQSPLPNENRLNSTIHDVLNGKLAVYLDMHAHASKRGCFIYGNVMDDMEDQVQNQLFCRLIALNTPHFDYDGCLFSKEHMTRIDPGDMNKGLSAEGSGRVGTFLRYGLIHSYTLECNYNTGRIANEISAIVEDPCGAQMDIQSSTFSANPEKYTPISYRSVGRAIMLAILDIRGQNPCSRIPQTRFRNLEKIRQSVIDEVRQRKEYAHVKTSRRSSLNRKNSEAVSTTVVNSCDIGYTWKKYVDQSDGQEVSVPSTVGNLKYRNAPGVLSLPLPTNKKSNTIKTDKYVRLSNTKDSRLVVNTKSYQSSVTVRQFNDNVQTSTGRKVISDQVDETHRRKSESSSFIPGIVYDKNESIGRRGLVSGKWDDKVMKSSSAKIRRGVALARSPHANGTSPDVNNIEVKRQDISEFTLEALAIKNNGTGESIPRVRPASAASPTKITSNIPRPGSGMSKTLRAAGVALVLSESFQERFSKHSSQHDHQPISNACKSPLLSSFDDSHVGIESFKGNNDESSKNMTSEQDYVDDLSPDPHRNDKEYGVYESRKQVSSTPRSVDTLEYFAKLMSDTRNEEDLQLDKLSDNQNLSNSLVILKSSEGDHTRNISKDSESQTKRRFFPHNSSTKTIVNKLSKSAIPSQSLKSAKLHTVTTVFI